MNYHKEIATIAGNRTLGSRELIVKAAAILRSFIQGYRGNTLTKELLVLGTQLIKGQPDMAAFINLMDDLLSQKQTDQMMQTLEIAPFVPNPSTLALFSDGETIITTGRSSTVATTLDAIQKNRKGCRIVLHEQGTTLTQRASCIIVGADAIYNEAFVNQIGTKALARAREIPFYVAAETAKYLPLKRRSIAHKELFESIPTARVTAFLTEGGPIGISDFPKKSLHFPALFLGS